MSQIPDPDDLISIHEVDQALAEAIEFGNIVLLISRLSEAHSLPLDDAKRSHDSGVSNGLSIRCGNILFRPATHCVLRFASAGRRRLRRERAALAGRIGADSFRPA